MIMIPTWYLPEGYTEFNTLQKVYKDKKTGLSKVLVEIADLCKLVLNKIMTTHE